jgi:putative Holliday junction resolvase
MRSGIRIGIDVGKVRIGLSQSDPYGILATPCETVTRDNDGVTDLVRISEVTRICDAMEVIVGLPLSLSGSRTLSTDDAIDFATRFATFVDIPVRLIDERLSTVSAQGALRASGRRVKESRSVIDQVAAVIVLQHALDTERESGLPPGELVLPIKGT